MHHAVVVHVREGQEDLRADESRCRLGEGSRRLDVQREVATAAELWSPGGHQAHSSGDNHVAITSITRYRWRRVSNAPWSSTMNGWRSEARSAWPREVTSNHSVLSPRPTPDLLY